MLSRLRGSGFNLTGKRVKDKESKEEEKTPKSRWTMQHVLSYRAIGNECGLKKTRAKRQDVKITELGD